MKILYIESVGPDGPVYAEYSLAGCEFAVGAQGELAVIAPRQELPVALFAAGVWQHVK